MDFNSGSLRLFESTAGTLFKGVESSLRLEFSSLRAYISMLSMIFIMNDNNMGN